MANFKLSPEMLLRFQERAPIYDRENRFFSEDFEELRETEYLNLAVPKEMGGHGLNLAEYGKLVREMSYYAPATALATNMHVYWTGIAADLMKSGDDSLKFVLEDSMAGEVLAAGHSESGNDVPLLYSMTNAEKVDGGYRFTGRKGFGSLSPVWTRFGLHGMDSSDPENPKIVHAFMNRDTEGYSIKESWDTMGMRATCSQDTILDGVFVPDDRVARVLPAGAGGADMFVVAVFAWALIGFANVYYGLARRACDIAVAGLKEKKSMAMTRPMSYHPEMQHGVAKMIMELEAMGPHLDKVAEDWSNGVDHGAEWPAKIMMAKHHAVEASWRVVDEAMELSGGFGMFKKSELERLFRDCRAGRFHPGNAALTHEFVAKTALGISPDEMPRWG
ncbi:MAG: alkylation response protein AidB-like acyl-CoA dehydrogenase [Candidatus Krumholzibacteriia bacterium]|jgi:alkylation response protein AidB-like acyl-CoA dehydrogenase